MSIAETYLKEIEGINPVQFIGNVTRVLGLIIEATGPSASVGELVHIRTPDGRRIISAEVVGFREGRVQLMPYSSNEGIAPGSEVMGTMSSLRVGVSEKLLGRIIGGDGNSIDGKPNVETDIHYPILASPPNPLDRPAISEVLSLGVKSIDGCITIGRGQRIGIFSGSGVGKSTLLGMCARYTNADVNVIALIGERGREVNDFIKNSLGEEGLKRSVLVVATGDQSPLMRLRGAFVATAIAEFFRDRGRDVMLMMDSVTRFARAQREIGLAVGEPPATRGFTPSVFEILPRLLERSGTSRRGSITGIYTILVEADDMNEPIADNVRGILDGHIVLNRNLADRGQYPAVDVTSSISRLMIDVVSPEHLKAAIKLRSSITVYRDAEDLINIGAYVKGSNPDIDFAIRMKDKIWSFLAQGIREAVPFEKTAEMLTGMFK